MFNFPPLNFPQYTFRTTLRDDQYYIWDNIRGQWLLLTPEEWVRQHTIRFIAEEMGVAAGNISQEYPIVVGGQTNQRADIVVFDKNTQPQMLVECKAIDVPISSEVLAQAIRYNFTLNAPFLFLTNGKKHYFYTHQQSGEYAPLKSVPKL